MEAVVADSPAMPTPKIVADSYGNHYFTMIPREFHYEENELVMDNPPYGVAYKLELDGSKTELWRVNGWYAFETYLAPGGMYLVRMGNWASGCGASEEDLAVAFYKNGIEIKSYSTKDLIKDKNSVTCSVSHYMWQKRREYPSSISYSGEFKLETIEGKSFVFNVKTGEIKP